MGITGIRVVIADDHAVVRAGTQRTLDECEDIHVVGQADDGARAVELVRELQPDVAILDVRLPELSGIEAARRIAALSPATKVLCVSAYESDGYVLAAMRAGAAGYVLKTAPLRELIEAVRAVYCGETVLQPTLVRKVARLLGQPRAGSEGPAGEPLTPREAEVLELVAQGLRNREVAKRLDVSRRTVDWHLKAVFNKLGVETRTQAVMYAVAHHLLPEVEA